MEVVLGWTVSIYWPLDTAWYNARVIKIMSGKQFEVRYEMDGVVEVVDPAIRKFKILSKPWSESEVEKLMTAAFKYGQRTTDAMDWSKVMLAVGSRSLTDCQNKHAEVVQERRSLREEVEHHQCRLTLKVRRWTKMKHRGEEGEEDRNDWYVVEQRTNVTEMLRQVASFRSQTATTTCCITVLPEVGTSGAMDATKEGVHVQEKEKEGEEEEEGEQVQEKEEKKGRRKKRSVPTLPRGSHIFSGVPFHRMNYEKNLNMGAISRVMFEHVHPVGKE